MPATFFTHTHEHTWKRLFSECVSREQGWRYSVEIISVAGKLLYQISQFNWKQLFSLGSFHKCYIVLKSRNLSSSEWIREIVSCCGAELTVSTVHHTQPAVHKQPICGLQNVFIFTRDTALVLSNHFGKISPWKQINANINPTPQIGLCSVRRALKAAVHESNHSALPV